MNNGNIYNVIKKNDIIKIINSKITIIKSGNNYKALCPFHKEKTPSFYISKKYQKYYCFGCKKNGNVLNFLMEYKNISFNKAVDILSNNNFKKQNDNVEFLNLIETTNEICEIYYNNIKNSKNKNLFNFLIDRDIDNNLIETFKIGFVDNIENFLLKKFYKNNEKLNDCIKLGLIIENNKKKYDIFRNRVIFPIRNIYGNTIGFGGRFLNNEKKPKYINSKESKIFSKKKELYGIYENKIKYLKKNSSIIIVEGYIDVIKLHKYKIYNVLGVLGSIFCIEQLKKIKNFCNKIIFCFDGDEAGKTASIRTAYACLSHINSDFKFEFILLPESEDPDSYIKKFGKDQFLKILDKSVYILDYIYYNITKSLDINFFNNKIYVLEKFENLIKDLNNKNFIKKYILNKFYTNNIIEKEIDNDFSELKLLIIILLNKNLVSKINIKNIALKYKFNTNKKIKFLLENLIILNKNPEILNTKNIIIKIFINFNFNSKSYLEYLKSISKDTILKEFNKYLKKIYEFEKK